MKKNLLILILTGLLFACGSAIDSSSPDSSSSPDASSSVSVSAPSSSAPEISVQIENPQYVCVTSTLSLDDYVTVIGTDETYEAEIVSGSSVAALDEETHLLTVLEEGGITVRISVGDVTDHFSTTAICQEKYRYWQTTGALGKNYYIECLETSGTTVTMTGYGWIHNDKYFAYYDAIFGGGDYYYGVVESGNGKTHAFTMDDGEGNNLQIQSGRLYDFSTYYFHSDFPLTLDRLDYYEEDGNGHFYSADETVISAFCTYGLGINSPHAAYPSYASVMTVEYVSFTRADTDAELPCYLYSIYMTDAEQATILASWINVALIADPSLSVVEPLEEYVASLAEPEGYDLSAIYDKVAEISECRNYRMTVDTMWCNSNGQLIDMPSGAKQYMEPRTDTVYVTEEGIYTSFNSGSEGFECYHNETDENGDPIVRRYTNSQNGSKTETITGETVSDVASVAELDLSPVDSIVSPELWQDLNTYYYYENGSSISATYNGFDNSALTCYLSALAPKYGANFLTLTSTWIGSTMKPLSYYVDVSISLSGSNLIFQILLPYDSNEYLMIQITFSKIHITSLPNF